MSLTSSTATPGVHSLTEDDIRPNFSPLAVDLFCGAGGLSYGMQRSGIGIVAGLDADPACRHPFSTNVKAKFHELDIEAVSPEFVSSIFPDQCVRILAGCAPCQPYSPYAHKNSAKDQRWQLLAKFGELVREIKPDIVTHGKRATLAEPRCIRPVPEGPEGLGLRRAVQCCRPMRPIWCSPIAKALGRHGIPLW